MKLPLALAFAVMTTGAVAGIATSCGGDDTACAIHCEVAFPLPPPNDGGVAIDAAPVTCPDCADPTTGCPAGCEPVG